MNKNEICFLMTVNYRQTEHTFLEDIINISIFFISLEHRVASINAKSDNLNKLTLFFLLIFPHRKLIDIPQEERKKIGIN